MFDVNESGLATLIGTDRVEFPVWFTEIISECAKTTDSCGEGTQKAIELLLDHDQIEEVYTMLLQTAVARKIADARHTLTTRIDRASYSEEPTVETNGHIKRDTRCKVLVTDCPEIEQIARESVYDRFIGNTRLGNMTKSNLSEWGTTYHNQAKGVMLLAKLCTKLEPLVPVGKTVREVIKEKRLENIIKKVKEENEKTFA